MLITPLFAAPSHCQPPEKNFKLQEVFDSHPPCCEKQMLFQFCVNTKDHPSKSSELIFEWKLCVMIRKLKLQRNNYEQQRKWSFPVIQNSSKFTTIFIALSFLDDYIFFNNSIFRNFKRHLNVIATEG
mmetsp:Transcript_36652/g.46721  ORF Transcript_36652/g.46721 Transcript_36652/m.46721 type:complete len:128 (-) Transcript_36652:207-590(-)